MELFNRLSEHPELWETFIHGLCRRDVMSPVVSEHMIKYGYQVSYPGNSSFSICLTHDVDDIYPPLTHRVLSSLWCLKKCDWSRLKKQLFWNKLNKDASPYRNFTNIIELERKYNAKSTFYFMTASRDPKRFRYNIQDIATELKYIVKNGWEVGLHGGYYSFNNFNAIKQEKRRLEKTLGHEVIGYRNHYLRFKVPGTWEILEKCGFKYDSTYGYTNAIGFRNGMCHPFRPYNIHRQQWMDICELPLHVMESAMFDFVKPDEAWMLVKQMIDKVELSKGVLTVLWHNNVFGCPFRDNWSAIYEKILQYGREKNAWMTSGEGIWRWWKENGY